MPYTTTSYLLFAAAFALCARYASARLWPVARDLLGLGFLLWWDPRMLAIIGGGGVLAWLGGKSRRRSVFWGGIALVAVVFLAVRVLERGQGAIGLLAPAGFGFLALRLVHYWVERAQGALPPHGPRELLAWLCYLPTVLVGPVQRFDDWLRWERRRRWDEADAAEGLRRMLVGYASVVVLSFWLVGAELPRHLLWLPPSVAGALVGTATLYLTFSGLSSVAIGLGRLGGQRVPENFAAPFLATDLPAFWRSWHMTVSEWCRAYVYVPLLARARSARLAAVAAMATFALWHELTLGYLAWGAWHALGLALWYRLAPRELPRAWRPVGWVLTMTWVLAGAWLLRVWPRGTAWYAR